MDLAGDDTIKLNAKASSLIVASKHAIFEVKDGVTV